MREAKGGENPTTNLGCVVERPWIDRGGDTLGLDTRFTWTYELIEKYICFYLQLSS